MNLYKIDKVKNAIAVLDAETHRLKGYITTSPFKDLLMKLSIEDLGKIRNIIIQSPYITIYSYGSINIQNVVDDVRAKLEEISASAPYIIYKIRFKKKPGRKPGNNNITQEKKDISVAETDENQNLSEETKDQSETKQTTNDQIVSKKRRKRKKRKK